MRTPTQLRFLFLTCIFAAPAFLWPTTASGQTPISAEALEFFERKIRPVLVQHCYECHSAGAKKLKGGLALDSRVAMLEGGDNGPAIVPGDPDKSRLIDAIRYTKVDLKMPKKGKLADVVIADLTAWVKMGAPWPEEKLVKKNTDKAFDLAKRKQEHWCWQPIRVVETPTVKDVAWPLGDIDRFLLAKLEAKGLKPAPAAEPRTLLRRLYFDLIGLPPSRVEVEEFVQAWDGANAKRGEIYENVVDRLLASPQFGERWARHWLDLVRYAESRGHEFDYTIPNAYHYRDYVIRALNADVPYHQFVREHLAGDLLRNPRIHKDGFNESILGTAFWFLGEECHSPVDIRQDQADRFDNRIDVMTKTFLGLTVACARCHDHKFDAISTKDYYALFGVLESSNYRLARFDTITQHRKIAEELWAFRKRSGGELGKVMANAVMPTIKKLDVYLLTAAGIEDRAKELDPALLAGWKQALVQAAKNEASPLHVFAAVNADRERPVTEVLANLQKRWTQRNGTKLPMDVQSIVDFSTSKPGASSRDWLPDDVAFGPGPVRRGDIILDTSANRPIARIAVDGSANFDLAWSGLKPALGTQGESGSLGGATRAGRTLRTPEFTIEHGNAYALVKGNGMVYLGVGQHIMLAGPLHRSLVQKFNTGGKLQWVAVSLSPYKGHRAHLEFTPSDNGEFELVRVVSAANAPQPVQADRYLPPQEYAGSKSLADIAKICQLNIRDAALRLAANDLDQANASAALLANWLVQNSDLFFLADAEAAKSFAKIAGPILDQRQKLLAQVKLDSRLTPAMQDGSGTDERVFIRGNPKTLGDIAPRRHLEAFVGTQATPIQSGSGRLELAKQMTDPKVTPHISRVYVNRVWHHVFGRGIVASVDNFGVLGDAPTHPELLDYLADQFVKDGWSTKKLIRALVLTRAYQMTSHADEKTDDADPGNLLLHRMRLRRLEGEAIRDAMLKVSGRLNVTMYGPSIPVHLTPFQEGRGRPASGPLDGDGRRSIYLGVRRNFLSSFLLAFDTPAPFSTVGRRSNSNVPAQALILMNDPFVHNQAEVWAKRVLAEPTSDEQRVRDMYLDAFARPPNELELRACVSYLGTAPTQRRWADLAHVLMNAKEFYFVN
jgi:hypothetical protein